MPKRLAAARPEAVRAFAEAASLEMVGRSCKLQPYQRARVPWLRPESDLIAFASPDSTWAVTRSLVEAAERSILIGIYDFTASYVKELLVKAMRRGVKVTLMLDIDGRTGETELFEELGHLGANCTPAPSCASKRARFFASSHEKVIVIDDEWTVVQSGNYSDNSIPQNDRDGGDPRRFVPGNRDMGVAVRSRPLARFFTQVLEADIKLETSGSAPEAAGGLPELAAIEATQAAPPHVPPSLFRSRRFNPARPIPVLPVLSPDNYLDVIPDFLAAATKSIRIEQQYIRGSQPHVASLLQAIRQAADANPSLVVQVVLAKPFPSSKTFEREAEKIKDLGTQFGFKLGAHVRILNPQYFVHCHNKLIVVDDQQVLVSSQNWSDSAVGLNREAGLLIDYAPVARYFSKIFQLDWATGLQKLTLGRPELFSPEALGTGKVVPLN